MFFFSVLFLTNYISPTASFNDTDASRPTMNFGIPLTFLEFIKLCNFNSPFFVSSWLWFVNVGRAKYLARAFCEDKHTRERKEDV